MSVRVWVLRSSRRGVDVPGLTASLEVMDCPSESQKGDNYVVAADIKDPRGAAGRGQKIQPKPSVGAALRSRHGDAVAQSLAFEQLHHDEVLIILMIDFVNSADVGMAEGRRRPRFTLEAIKRHCICTELGRKKFQRYVPAKRHIFAFVTLRPSRRFPIC